MTKIYLGIKCKISNLSSRGSKPSMAVLGRCQNPQSKLVKSRDIDTKKWKKMAKSSLFMSKIIASNSGYSTFAILMVTG